MGQGRWRKCGGGIGSGWMRRIGLPAVVCVFIPYEAKKIQGNSYLIVAVLKLCQSIRHGCFECLRLWVAYYDVAPASIRFDYRLYYAKFRQNWGQGHLVIFFFLPCN